MSEEQKLNETAAEELASEELEGISGGFDCTVAGLTISIPSGSGEFVLPPFVSKHRGEPLPTLKDFVPPGEYDISAAKVKY